MRVSQLNKVATVAPIRGLSAILAVLLCMSTGCSRSQDDTASGPSSTEVVAAASSTIASGELAEQVRAELADPVLGVWVTGALATAKVPADQVCATPYIPFDQETFERAREVGDQVTAEMLVNLDAALGAAAEWCRQGNPSEAAGEHADAHATADAIETRLVEIGVR